MLHNRLDPLSIKLLPLEHKVWSELKTVGIKKQRLILAVSGGLDSIALAYISARLAPLHQCEMIIAHVHHGGSTSKAQTRFRDKAQSNVRETAKKLKIKFVTNKKELRLRLKSEAEFREYRYHFLERLQTQWPSSVIVTAHHADDLLETQMLRLVRGVGPQGLEGMSFFNNKKLRPLLHVSRRELEVYCKKLKLKWVEDPSNKNLDPLRNWMRQHWLLDLDKKWPGARESLRRSLLLITEKMNLNTSIPNVFHDGTIDRQSYLALSRVEQGSALANYLKTMQIKNYTQGQIHEIRKRLDNSRGEYRFTLLKHVWHVNARRIHAVKI